jgi:hypothetical protein
MGFVARALWFAAVGLLGFEAAGCGQVSGANGGEGSLENTDGLPPSAQPFAFAKSGERVQALGYLSEGVAQFRTLHDQKLDFDCTFKSGKVCGELRCVPKQSAQLIFLDANCSEPATWMLDEGAHVGAWVTTEQLISDCGDDFFRREPFEIGEEVYPEGPPGGVFPKVYQLRDAACTAASPPAKSIPAVNRLLPHADTELVAAKRVSIDVGGGLRLARAVGEDGSEFVLAVTTADGVACSVQPDGECVPLGQDATGSFPNTQRIRQGSGAAHVDLFTSSPGAGRPGVPVAQFPEALDFVDDAGHRCRVVEAVDGTRRCAVLEPIAYESGYWSDAACTQRLRYDPSGAEPSHLRVALRAEGSLLSAVSTVKTYDGPVFAITNGACVASFAVGPVFALDERIDASTLPQVFETSL